MPPCGLLFNREHPIIPAVGFIPRCAVDTVRIHADGDHVAAAVNFKEILVDAFNRRLFPVDGGGEEAVRQRGFQHVGGERGFAHRVRYVCGLSVLLGRGVCGVGVGCRQ